MKNKIFAILTLFILSLSSESFSLDEISLEKFPTSLAQYTPIKIKFTIPIREKDPNNFQSIRVGAKIMDPNNRKMTVPAFCIQNKGANNSSLWEVRFTPRETGLYKFSFYVSSRGYSSRTEQKEVFVEKSDKNGFLRRSKNNPYYLVFDSGKPFFGIGHNIGWVGNDSVNLFKGCFTLLQENGCNITRIWMCDWALPIEWEKLGTYNEESLLKLDEILSLCYEKGIYVILTFDTYGNLMTEKGRWGEGRWEVNPYNIKNGGPCKDPDDFFTDKKAKEIYKKRLRYLISRYSYSPNVFAFELWNECNAPLEWTEEMAGYIKQISPYPHFVTTSLGYPWSKPFDEAQIWDSKKIDLITLHLYGNGTNEELIEQFIRKNREVSQRYNKPFIFSEFGIDANKDDKAYDSLGEGAALHNSLWASMVSKSCSTSMYWWWDTYIRPKNLYYHYKALSNFVQNVNWDAENIYYIEVSNIYVPEENLLKGAYYDKVIVSEDKWEKIPINEFNFTKKINKLSGSTPNKYLHGMDKKDIKADHIYYLDYPNDGEFIVHIGTVSQGGILNIFVDEKEVLKKEYYTGKGKGKWRRSNYIEEYDIYQCVYDEDVRIKVTKGEHTIKLVNSGKDWIGIDRVILANYIDGVSSKLDIQGLNVGEQTLIWIKNREYNWKAISEKREISEIKSSYFDLENVSEGKYIVEFWNTFSGGIITTEEVTSTFGKIRIKLPAFTKDIACKIFPKK